MKHEAETMSLSDNDLELLESYLDDELTGRELDRCGSGCQLSHSWLRASMNCVLSAGCASNSSRLVSRMKPVSIA